MVDIRELSEEERKKHAEQIKDEGCTIHGSKEAPILVEERRYDAKQYISWEYDQALKELGPKTKHVLQSLLRIGEKWVDRLLFEAEDGSKHVYYFDVTAQLDAGMEGVAKAARGESKAPQGPRTRFVAIWHPGFEKGMSRMETIQTLKMAWTSKVPEMGMRREVVTKDTPNPEIIRKVDEWFLKTWNKTLGTRKRLSMVVITDPAWEESKDRFEMSAQALSAGYSSGQGKPQFCVVSLESPQGL